MKRSELEERRAKFEFYTNYIEISKLSLIYELERELTNLRSIQDIRHVNSKLLDSISSKWLKQYNDYYTENKKLPKLYILVSSERIDEYGKFAMKKLVDRIKKEFTPNDFIVTVGDWIKNDIRLFNLKVIENFSFESFYDTKKFAERMGSLIEVGLNNI